MRLSDLGKSRFGWTWATENSDVFLSCFHCTSAIMDEFRTSDLVSSLKSKRKAFKSSARATNSTPTFPISSFWCNPTTELDQSCLGSSLFRWNHEWQFPTFILSRAWKCHSYIQDETKSILCWAVTFTFECVWHLLARLWPLPPPRSLVPPSVGWRAPTSTVS